MPLNLDALQAGAPRRRGEGENILEAAVSDVGDIARGVMGIPKLGYQLLTSPTITGPAILKGIGEHFGELVADPVKTFKKRPVTTILDVLPIGAAGKFAATKYVTRPVVVKDVAEAATIGSKLRSWFVERQIGKLENDARELVLQRSGNIGVAKSEANRWTRENLGKFDNQTLEDMTFYVERTRNPRLDPKGAGVGVVEERLRAVPGAIEAAEKISARMEQFRQIANESGLAKHVGFLESYMPHFWKMSPKKAREVARRVSLQNRFANPREFRNYLQGMAAEFEPLTLNASDLARKYESMLATSIENNRLVRELQKLEVQPGQFAIMRASKAPADYVYMDHPSLRAPTRGISTIEGIAEDLGLPFVRSKGRGEKILGVTDIPRELKRYPRRQLKEVTRTQTMASVRVHPELVKPLKAIFEEPYSGNIARFVTKTNAWMKASALSFSLFHHIALTESAFAALGIKGISLGKGAGFRRGLEMMKDRAMSRTAIESGLNLGPLSDVQIGIVNRGLRNLEANLRHTPILGRAATGVRRGKELWDKGLWDYYHTGLKSYAFHTLYERALKKFPGKDAKLIGRDIASYVNDAFGGQSWERLMTTPRMQQALHWLFLAPDWTLSNLRISLHPFSKGVTQKMGLGYWARSAFAGYVMTNLANYAMTEYSDGKGRWLWDNEPGHKLDIQLPYKDDRGRRQYIKLGKQMREPLRWISEPLKIGGAKLAPSIQIAVEQLAGATPTGFPTEFKDVPEFEGLSERALSVAEKFVPFVVRGSQFGFALPKSAGTTGYKVIEGLKRAMRDNDRQKMVEWMRAAANNGYNARQLMAIARREFRSEKRKEVRERMKERRK